QSCNGGSTCCPSTPYLFTYAGDRYLIESDVMNTYYQHSNMTVKDAQAAYETGMQSAEFLSQDIYKMRLQPEVTGGAIRLRIRELEPEESQLDRVRLVRVVHSRDSMAFSDNNKIYSAKITEIKPLSCTDESNSDCLDQISSDDMNYLRKDRGQYIIVRFRLDNSPSNNLLAINSWENDFIPPIVSSPYAEGYSPGGSIRISYHNNGAWRAGNDFHPRALKSTQYGIAVDSFADSEGFITLKLEWTGLHVVDKIAIVSIAEQPMKQEELSLISAQHSQDSDVTSSLLEKDFVYAHTVRGDSIDLEFDAGKMQPGPGETVDYFFISEGYYHGLRTYLYPDVDTSDSFKAEVNKYIEELNGYLGVAN
ncbi:MAG: hypothetical protein MUP55_01180, partial [Candidatus Aenigmarchaeota archaeon]|nr:hypothetical protein [Candidatus Aenigmarchaeota archaeon]